MMLVALFTTLAMAMIAAIHAYWAFGGLWPASSENALSMMVVGDPRLRHMPPRALTLTVAIVLAGIAAWPLLLAPALATLVPRGLIQAATGCLAMVFLARGIASYFPGVRRLNSVQPFTDLNRRYYAPLCLLLGSCFLALAFKGV